MAQNIHCCLFVLVFLISHSHEKFGMFGMGCLLQFCPILRFSSVNISLWILFPKCSFKWHFWALFAIAPSLSSQRLLLFTPFSDSVSSIDTALFHNCPSVQSKEHCTPRYTIKNQVKLQKQKPFLILHPLHYVWPITALNSCYFGTCGHIPTTHLQEF